MAITVIRRYYKVKFVSSFTYETELHLTLRIMNNPTVLLLPISNVRGDLSIKNSKDHDFILLSNIEYEKLSGYPLEKINEKYIEKIAVAINESDKKKFLNTHTMLPILLQQDKEEYYEKIVLRWIQKGHIKNEKHLDEFVEVPVNFLRYGVYDSKTAAIYLSVETVDRYTIMEDLKFNDLLTGENIECTKILETTRHKIYRLNRVDKAQIVSSIIKISVPDEKLHWARAGLGSSSIIPIFLLTVYGIYQIVPPFSYEILGGLIAFLIGQRAILFQDINLMKRWNRAHKIAALFCAFVLILLIMFQIQSS